MTPVALLSAPAPVRAPLPADAPRVLDLTAYGDRLAVVTDQEQVSYADLAARVAARARQLGETRRLVLVEGRNTLPSLIDHLAALTAGHVVLLAPPGAPAARLAQAWSPDAVLADGTLTERRPGTAHDLHPDLALLTSTSGSTGAPRLVRLSHENLRSNAAAIASFLSLGADDRALTTLPLHYCYGLSVVHSHLLVGAGLVLSEQSVVAPCLWRLAREAGATSFAGVPHTFDLLEHSGFDPAGVPTLRQVTQAGGRLAAERVLDWHARGARAGWDLVVMYGQTEATARMAWLPPHLTVAHPGAVGVPVPGGSLRLEPVDDAPAGVGELVYSGPNVMLGYAERPGDLALGATLTELRTGDLGRRVPLAEGGEVWELAGRRDRHAKLFGLRLDLDELERRLPDLHVAVVDGHLHGFATDRRAGSSARGDARRAALVRATGLPASAVRVHRLDRLPRTPSGKPDRAALAAHARRASTAEPDAGSVRDDVAVVLGLARVEPEATFVDLGGDSLSYVELATRLRRRLGDLPASWHLMPVADLEALAAGRRPESAVVPVDTSVVLRALAIVAIVGTHANLFTIVGGAHVLLVVAGWNFARFRLSAADRATRLRRGLASVGRVALPALVWIGLVGLVAGTYRPATALLLNQAVGADAWTVQWQFWFLEALVWTTTGSLALLTVPALDRWERRSPWGFALALLLAGLAVRFAWVGLQAGPTERYTTGVVAWWFLLGWLATRADRPRRRAGVLMLAAAGTVGFFGDPAREALILAGVAALVLAPTVPVPRRLVGPLGVLAASSLFVYLTHWQVYPWLEARVPVLATAASFAVGIAAWRGWNRCCAAVRSRTGGALIG